jgi:hypothetical protein
VTKSKYIQCANCDWIGTKEELVNLEGDRVPSCPSCHDGFCEPGEEFCDWQDPMNYKLETSTGQDSMTEEQVKAQIAWQKKINAVIEGGTYTENEISHIAVELNQNENYSHFLRLLGGAWQIADPTNKPLLRPVMEELIKKYDLEKLFNFDYGVDKGKRMVEECTKQ